MPIGSIFIFWTFWLAANVDAAHWIRKRAPFELNPRSMGSSGPANISDPSILATQPPWPGQDNAFPFASQWGAWNQQQQQQFFQGSGPRPYQPKGLQINPSQAEWYPNSPEYHGFDASYVARLKAMQQNGAQVLPGGQPTDVGRQPTGGVVYWPPPPSTSTLSPEAAAAWSTWGAIQAKGVGGMLRQWVNWYQNPDLAGQQQEALNVKQSQLGRFPDGRPVPNNLTFLDDTHKILVDILAGFVAGTTPKKAAMHNMRTYYTQYRRDYWIGERYFHLDPQTTLASYITCKFDLPSDINVLYEINDTRVGEVLFQCIKYQETCCNLNCCDLKGRPLFYQSLYGRSSANVGPSSTIWNYLNFVFCNILLYLMCR